MNSWSGESKYLTLTWRRTSNWINSARETVISRSWMSLVLAVGSKGFGANGLVHPVRAMSVLVRHTQSDSSMWYHESRQDIEWDCGTVLVFVSQRKFKVVCWQTASLPWVSHKLSFNSEFETHLVLKPWQLLSGDLKQTHICWYYSTRPMAPCGSSSQCYNVLHCQPLWESRIYREYQLSSFSMRKTKEQ